MKLWDVATGRLLRSLPRFESSIQSIAFSPDGRLLATGQFGPAAQPVQVWDLATLQAFVPPDDELGQSAYGVAFSPDGKILAACGDGLTLWRVADGEKSARNAPRLSFHHLAHLPGRRSLYLCISPNGKLLASGLFDEIYVQPAAGDDGAAVGAAVGGVERSFRLLPRGEPQ